MPVECPYRAGGSVGGTRSFVGRREILDQLRDFVNDAGTTAIALNGQRKSGKSSILHHFETMLREAHSRVIPVYIDLQNFIEKSLDVLATELASLITRHYEKPMPIPRGHAEFLTVWVPLLISHLDNDRRIVLLVDEFDAELRIALPEKYAFFHDLIHASVVDGAHLVCGVFAVGRTIGPPDERIIRLVASWDIAHVGMLEEDEFDELLALGKTELCWSKEVRETIWRLTSGHPYLTQMLCSVLWRRLSSRAVDKAYTVTQGDVQGALEQTLSRSEMMFKWVWYALDEHKRGVVRRVATDEPLIPEDDEHVADLVAWDLLRLEGAQPRFQVELVREWVRRRTPRPTMPPKDDRLPPHPPAPCTTFSWLHFTDFHQGVRGLETLYPLVEQDLLEDLDRNYAVTGPWDVVIFTGDLTQSGTRAEFEAFTRTMTVLWEHFQKLGCNPKLVTVPGNHDLRWQDPDDEIVDHLINYHERRLSAKLWNRDSKMHQLVCRAFEEYSAWHESHPFPRLEDCHPGYLPGDFTAQFTKDGLKIGFVGLNTAFLQLVDGAKTQRPNAFKGHLAIELQQYNEVGKPNGATWVRKANDLAFLLTHHPPDWLSESGTRNYNLIHAPGQFVAHMFGHVHEGRTIEVREGSGFKRRFWQGASLFGLTNHERAHGYTVGRLQVDSREPLRGDIRLWPRLAVNKHAGQMRLDRDPAFDLLTDGGTAADELYGRD